MGIEHCVPPIVQLSPVLNKDDRVLIEFHRNMLADRVRNEAFYQALKHVIRDGETALADLGSGTGLLGFLASRLGAREIYLYEYSEALKLSQRLAKANRVRRCHFIHQHSAQVRNPVPVDVIVSETLGNYAYEEHLIENLEDAKRFLKPNGIIIPQRVEQFVVPVINARYYQELVVWNDVGYEINFALAKEMSLNNLYVRSFAPADLLDEAAGAHRWDVVDFRKKNGSVRRGSAQWQLKRDVTVYGFAVWWTAELVPGVSLSTSPLAPRTHWEQLYFPLHEPMTARTNETLAIELNSDSRYEIGVNLRWQASLQQTNGEVVTQALDMKKGDIR